MSKYEHDLMVYIGRFQPLHNGHIHTIRLALKTARRVIILVGSHNAPLTCRNPWTSEERMTMIRESLSSEEYHRCLVAGLEDFTYNDDKWENRVKEIVSGFKGIYGGVERRVAITGFDRDSTSYYLNKFPDWKTSLEPEIEKIGATEIRNMYFGLSTVLTDVLPDAVAKFLIDYKKSQEFQLMKDEWYYCKQYKIDAQGNAAFPVIIHTVDCVVKGPRGVVLIKRKGYPGKGKWALPGGHLEPNETLFQAAKRELEEETSIQVPDHLLQKQHTFDDPNRSPRGRCITTAFYFEMNNSPEIKAGDDAAEVKIFTTGEIQRMRSQIHEDHYHIIDFFLNMRLTHE